MLHCQHNTEGKKKNNNDAIKMFTSSHHPPTSSSVPYQSISLGGGDSDRLMWLAMVKLPSQGILTLCINCNYLNFICFIIFNN